MREAEDGVVLGFLRYTGEAAKAWDTDLPEFAVCPDFEYSRRRRHRDGESPAERMTFSRARKLKLGRTECVVRWYLAACGRFVQVEENVLARRIISSLLFVRFSCPTLAAGNEPRFIASCRRLVPGDERYAVFSRA